MLTVGQIVWYYPAEHTHDEQPLAAIVTYVWPGGENVNVVAFTDEGSRLPVIHLPFAEDAQAPDSGSYCTPVGQERESKSQEAPGTAKGRRK